MKTKMKSIIIITLFKPQWIALSAVALLIIEETRNQTESEQIKAIVGF